MSETKVNWHKYPDEKPKEEGFYLTTISEDNENYISLCKYSKKQKWAGVNVIAWKEMPWIHKCKENK